MEILYIGESKSIPALISPSNATNKNIIWSSDNESVAIVNDGIVSGLSLREASITAKTEDGGFIAVCKVKVVPVKPNRTRLEQLIESCEALESDKYTEESWQNLMTVLEKAKLVSENSAADQDEIDNIANELSLSRSLLVEKISRETLAKEIEKSENLNKDLYTDNSWLVFSQMLSDAKNALISVYMTQNMIEMIAENLRIARENLILLSDVPPIDYLALKYQIYIGEALDGSHYTAETFNAYKYAVEAAKTLMTLDYATQYDVDTMTEVLEDYYFDLEKIELAQDGDIPETSIECIIGDSIQLTASCDEDVNSDNTFRFTENADIITVTKSGNLTALKAGTATIYLTDNYGEIYDKKTVNIVYLGDANRDGKVNILDLIRMKKYNCGQNVEICIVASDFTANGIIQADDLAELKMLLLNS